ncbi:MarR family winged helix-turn-helix transcriptional regulator [Streptomyces sp. NPDC056161]|uniref:MarR family winged helix-turn-helix transcriptional regulator n=1 Tax=Streptomyces sp. NPDC056161 TaxID=3345732 RepID=UPI0035D605E8
MPGRHDHDSVDEIIDRWRAKRPELDLSPIAIIGRIVRAARLVVLASDEYLAEYGLSRGEFDILSALRRYDEPLTPSALTAAVLASPAATTKRLHSLRSRGLVERSVNPDDRRSALVRITAAGTATIDLVMPAQLAVEAELLTTLDDADNAALADALRQLLAAWERRI